jgi:DNA-binding Lrp family transcriptional regulator
MVHAFVMVKTEAGDSERLVDAVRGLEDVLEAHIVAGSWDVVAEVDAAEMHEILKTASREIQGLRGVVDTKTYISIDG